MRVGAPPGNESAIDRALRALREALVRQEFQRLIAMLVLGAFARSLVRR